MDGEPERPTGGPGYLISYYVTNILEKPRVRNPMVALHLAQRASLAERKPRSPAAEW